MCVKKNFSFVIIVSIIVRSHYKCTCMFKQNIWKDKATYIVIAFHIYNIISPWKMTLKVLRGKMFEIEKFFSVLLLLFWLFVCVLFYHI